jgi:PPOX class probable F420-dependent enzyme
MSVPLTDEARALLAGPNTAHLASLRPDGTPASHPVWVGLDDRDRVLVSTGRSRPKVRNVEHDPHVALSLTAHDNPYEELMARGTVVEVRADPDLADMHPISQTYIGRPFPFNSGEQVTIVIAIDWFHHHKLPFEQPPTFA